LVAPDLGCKREVGMLGKEAVVGWIERRTGDGGEKPERRVFTACAAAGQFEEG